MSTPKTARKHSKRLILIPLIAGLLLGAMYLFPAWRVLENRLYDGFLGLKPPVTEHHDLVLLDIDEEAIVRSGAWPWPRGLVARGMEVLAEIGARYAVFDIEYLENSPMSVDRPYLETNLKDEFNTVFAEISSNLNELFQALAAGQITLSDAIDYADMLLEDIEQQKNTLYDKTGRVAVENDSYLGQSMRLFGNSFVTLNMQEESTGMIHPDRQELAKQKFAYQRIDNRGGIPSKNIDYLLPIMEVSTMAKQAGFTNVHIDLDGVRRRIRLIDWIDGRHYLQLATAPLIDWMGNPEILVEKSQITFKNATWNGITQDIKIPLDSKGMMLIRWPKKNYIDSFRHISFYRLLEYRNAEEDLATNLRNLRTSQVWLLGIGYGPISGCLDAYAWMDEARLIALASGDEQDRANWLKAKAQFRETLQAFFDLDFGSSIPAALNAARDTADPALAARYDELRDQFISLYQRVADNAAFLQERLEFLTKELAGSFNVIGWTGTATTDIGVNPFYEKYINVGTHTAVANTIIQQDFLREAPLWLSSLLSLLLPFVVVWAISKLKTGQRIGVGFVATAAILLVFYGIFHFTGLYIAVLSPLLATFMSFLSYSLISFLISEREKSFLRKAFSTYLSGDIINELVADPAMLKLGGQKKFITAMFTDVRGFSTISEAIDAEQLVALLNIYLSGMSDLVLEHQGTIDKYEGDAIIAFFGAPVTDEKHAYKACVSAIRMKQIEVSMNERFMAERMSPNPLVTRIGLNTGDMVVGNMGTEKKMNYTIMGNAVNLAARLEGVNKQYGSWILASDDTLKAAGDSIVARELDRVRVVGINTPVRLWEILTLRQELTPAMTALIDGFKEAHNLFEERDYVKSEHLFGQLCAAYPDDGPSATYLKRSRNFQEKPPAASWDGVFNLTEK